MTTAVLISRHSVRGIPDKVELANGSVVKLQDFSVKPLPLYSSPVNTEENGTLAGTGWQLSEKFGKFLRKKFKSDIYIRGSVETDRTVNTAIATARGVGVKFIDIYNGKTDPLFFPQIVYGYKSDNLQGRQNTFNRLRSEIDQVANAITEVFGVPLPKETKITETEILGRLRIEDVMSQEPNFALYSNIDLGISGKNRELICKGIVLRQEVDNQPLFVQQQSSNLVKYILDTLEKKDQRLTVLTSNDNPITSLAALLDYRFTIPGWPEQFVNVNSGILFLLKHNRVKVLSLGPGLESNFITSPITEYNSLECFKEFIQSKINFKYVNLSEIDNINTYRVS